MEGESASAPDRALIEIIDVAARAATAYERPDLLPRLERARRRIAEPDLTVLVAGEFKKGKSSLVNALLGTVVCPVDDDVATAVPTMVRYGSEPAARARYEGSDELEAIDPAELAAIVTEAAAGDRRVTAVEVELPRRLLQGGIRLVDTPGVGGLESAHGAVTLGAIAMADAVVFVTDASQELTAPELGFLQRVHGLCPNVRIVMTKTDFYPAWRRILELDRGHLAAAGLDFEILPTSSALRTAALRSERRDLNDESGFSALVAWLLEAGRNAQALSARASVHDVLRVVDQIRSTFAAERDALADPEAAAALVARLDEAKERADELKGRSARWTQTLGDGITDLGSDVNHALRSGMRTVIEE
ncbi:MAG: dynamin family protein, partial [Acidimicrobiia bacterium]|nr:dynamin family protein [Acidimicrobiia bacterium]